MREYFSILSKLFLLVLICFITFILIRSSLDIYNNFAYDKAIIKDSPFGYTPLLNSPKDYSNYNREIHSGEYVYVVDWLSAYNGKVIFAKVKSRLNEGYVNKELLVQTNLNVKPIISLILLITIFVYSLRKVYHKFA